VCAPGPTAFSFYRRPPPYWRFLSMSFSTLFSKAKRRSLSSRTQFGRRWSSGTCRGRGRLCLEPLEDRCLLSLFGPHTDSAVGGPLDGLVTGDFNEDGHIDLATTDFQGGNIKILMGRGDGTFSPPVAYHVGVYASFLTVGDLDGDGHLDL